MSAHDNHHHCVTGLSASAHCNRRHHSQRHTPRGTFIGTMIACSALAAGGLVAARVLGPTVSGIAHDIVLGALAGPAIIVGIRSATSHGTAATEPDTAASVRGATPASRVCYVATGGTSVTDFILGSLTAAGVVFIGNRALLNAIDPADSERWNINHNMASSTLLFIGGLAIYNALSEAFTTTLSAPPGGIAISGQGMVHVSSGGSGITVTSSGNGRGISVVQQQQQQQQQRQQQDTTTGMPHPCSTSGTRYESDQHPVPRHHAPPEYGPAGEDKTAD